MRIRSLSVRTFLLLAGFVGLVGCGNDNDNNANQPAPGEQPAEVTTWAEVDYRQLLPEPPQQCGEHERFEVRANGAWTWKWCADEKAGTLSAADLNELNRRVVAVQESGIEREEVCLELSYAGSDRLDVTFIPEGLISGLHTMNQAGSCFRADIPLVNSLEEKTRELMKKYTGVSNSVRN